MNDSEFNFGKNGTLPEGIHKPLLSEFKKCMVDGFPNSKTRQTLYRKYICFSEKCTKHPFIMVHWVDGSYVTNKPEPNDVDISLRVIASEFGKHIDEGGSFLKDTEDIKIKYSCDIYLILEYPIDDPRYEITTNREKYWRNWWGHTRENAAKGFVEFNFEEENHVSNILIECKKLDEIL